MKKRQVDHVLRAAGRITGEKRFGMLSIGQLLTLLEQTKLADELRARIRARIAADFAPVAAD